MSVFLDPFQYEFMRKALLGCLLVGFTNGYLSGFIVLRRHALLADGLSHSLLPGLAVGAIFFSLNPVGLFLGALVAALLVVLGGKMITHSSRLKDDTSIGALYIAAFALGIILLKFAPVRVDLSHFLFGNVLGMANGDLWITYALSFFIVLVLTVFHRQLLLALFDPVVASSMGLSVAWLDYLLIGMMVMAMIASLQAVGAVMSIGLLILPAATIYLLSDSYDMMVWGGAFLGMVSAVAGLLLSYWVNLPSGPAIVMVLSAVFVAAYLFGPRYGVINRLLNNRRAKRATPPAPDQTGVDLPPAIS